MLESVLLDPKLLAPETVRPLSRSEYDRLVAAGAFENERIELLCGQLVTMSPQGEPHSRIAGRLAAALARRLGPSFDVRSHSPFAATEDSEPEPDVWVARWQLRPRYHPKRALLLIEVADSSLRIDRHIKARIYAQNRAPEYWVIDLNSESVLVHTEPRRGEYRRIVEARGRMRLRPVHLPRFSITVAQLFRL